MPVFRAQLPSLVLALSAIFIVSCAQRVSVRENPLAASAVSRVSTTAISHSREAYDSLRGGDPSEDAVAAYNTAVAGVLEMVKDSPGEPELKGGRIEIADQGDGISIDLAVAPGSPWDLDEIRSFRPAENLRIRGLRERVRTPGIGTPLVAEMKKLPGRPFAASSGSYLPATALLEFSSPNDATMTLFDPLQSPSALFLGEMRPLRADYSAPLATTFAMRDQQRINIPALFLFEKFQKALGLHQLDSVYPGKIPVVFVHGLKSNPDTWRNPINELMADPVIRARFEFWNFGYATGPPIPFSAMQLRESLQQMAEYRNSLGARTHDVVLIGHSMGGLLSGQMTQSSGDENWFKLFENPLDELELPEADRDLLRRMAYYEPLPFVRRVVFVATPHGGSNFAGNPISRLASGLIQIPGSLLVLSTDILKAGVSVLTPIGREVVQNVPTSIDSLNSNSELVRLFRANRSNPKVLHHSIIGEHDPFVPYESAHIDEAVSEKLVPAGHEAHLHRDAIAELRRILREHIGE